MFTLYNREHLSMGKPDGFDALPRYLNLTYIIKNQQAREYFVELTRIEVDSSGTPLLQKYLAFTDTSASNVQRKHNAEAPVGENTYPYVNGVIWEPAQGGNSITIVTNRAGGVNLRTKSLDSLAFYLTRKVDNVNIDKGLPESLTDARPARSEFLLSISNVPGIGLQNQKRLVDQMNEKVQVIMPQYTHNLITDKQLFMLSSSNTFSTDLFQVENNMNRNQSVFEVFGDLDLLDTLHYNSTTYVRLRNYQDKAIVVNAARQLTETLRMELIDYDLYIHCLEPKREQYPQTASDDFIFQRRNLLRYNDYYVDDFTEMTPVLERHQVLFKPFELKCLRVVYHQSLNK